MYPGVFSGIGEFSIHKEFVTSKILGHGASLRNPALDRVLDFAGEVGLGGHSPQRHRCRAAHRCPRAGSLGDAPQEIFRSHADVTIIWAHTGLGRFVGPAPDHVQLLDGLLSDEAYCTRPLRPFVGRGSEVHRAGRSLTRRLGGASGASSRPVPVRHRLRGPGEPRAVSQDLA